jgi:cobalt-zinc-cadmium efflux system protein
MLHVEKRLLWAIAVTLLILVIEVIGGLVSNSLALLSDAGHVLTDTFALGLSLVASLMTHRPAGRKATYGYHRMGVLAASINGVILVAVALFIFMEAYQRFVTPPAIETGLMLVIASIGLLGNLLMAWFLKEEHHDLNIRSAWLHVISDAISSVGVIVAGLVILCTGWRLADPIASVVVGLLVTVGGIRVLREALRIFLELTPLGFDIEDISREIAELPEILGIHDVHIWSIAPGATALTAHLWVHDQGLASADRIREKVEHKLAHIGIRHTVLQLECAECYSGGLYCQIKTGMEHRH